MNSPESHNKSHTERTPEEVNEQVRRISKKLTERAMKLSPTTRAMRTGNGTRLIDSTIHGQDQPESTRQYTLSIKEKHDEKDVTSEVVVEGQGPSRSRLSHTVDDKSINQTQEVYVNFDKDSSSGRIRETVYSTPYVFTRYEEGAELPAESHASVAAQALMKMRGQLVEHEIEAAKQTQDPVERARDILEQ